VEEYGKDKAYDMIYKQMLAEEINKQENKSKKYPKRGK